MSSKELIKYLKNSISEKGNYCYSLPIETTKATIKHIKEKDKEIKRQKEIIRQLDIKNLELTSIIKEVREYIGLSDELRKLCTNYDVNGIDILEILDKENNNEDN